MPPPLYITISEAPRVRGAAKSKQWLRCERGMHKVRSVVNVTGHRNILSNYIALERVNRPRLWRVRLARVCAAAEAAAHARD